MVDSRTDGTPLLGSILEQFRISYSSTRSLEGIRCRHVVDDSREVRPGSVFVAVRGEKQDGHDHLADAVEGGAVAAVVCRPEARHADIPCVTVRDTRIVFARLTAEVSGLRTLQDAGEMTLTGITGTNGKSTTCHILRDILETAGQRVALLGTIQYELAGHRQPAPWTTPPAGRLAEALVEGHGQGARCGVMEVSSHALDQHRTGGVRFKVAVFTNLSGDHLDYHRDLRSYLAAKKRLFDALPPDGVAVVNDDDPATAEVIRDCPATLVRFGFDPHADVVAEDLSCDLRGSRFELRGDDRSDGVRFPLVGRHNVANALAAAGAARGLGIDWPTIRQALAGVRPVAGRLQQVQPDGHPTSVFVDYAHTDDALANALAALRPLTRGDLWCVFGCGGNRDRTKRPRMAAVSERLADRIVVTSDNPRNEAPDRIVNDILAGFSTDRRPRVDVDVDRATAIALALSRARKDDVVLIAGKGHEDYQLIGDRRLDFDDVEIARQCLGTGGARA